MDWAEAIEFIQGVHAAYSDNPVVDWVYRRVNLGHRSPELLEQIHGLRACGFAPAPVIEIPKMEADHA